MNQAIILQVTLAMIETMMANKKHFLTLTRSVGQVENNLKVDCLVHVTKKQRNQVLYTHE